MSNQINYEIVQGAVVSDCLPETHQFIEQNSQYFHTTLKPIRDALADEGDVVFISYEKSWSFASAVKKAELGRISSGKGAISEGGVCSYDELLSSLSS